VATIGVLVAFMQYAQRFFRPIQDLSEKYNILQSAMAAGERVFKLLDTKIEVTSPAVTKQVPRGRGGLNSIMCGLRTNKCQERKAADAFERMGGRGPRLHTSTMPRQMASPTGFCAMLALCLNRARRSPWSGTPGRARLR
jgi:ABC-type multidrug transport system fused ATPase/permease subunit